MQYHKTTLKLFSGVSQVHQAAAERRYQWWHAIPLPMNGWHDPTCNSLERSDVMNILCGYQWWSRWKAAHTLANKRLSATLQRLPKPWNCWFLCAKRTATFSIAIKYLMPDSVASRAVSNNRRLRGTITCILGNLLGLSYLLMVHLTMVSICAPLAYPWARTQAYPDG